MSDDYNDEIAEALALGLRRIAGSITDPSAAPANVRDGGVVGCLTEAVMYAANGNYAIASAINELADAVREAAQTQAAAAVEAAQIAADAREAA